jgi:hypothetical protein
MRRTDNYPSYIPTSADIGGLFEEYLWSEKGDIRKPSDRRQIIGHRFAKNLPDLAMRLHGFLTSRSESNYLAAESWKVMANHALRFHGLDRRDDFKAVVLPELSTAMAEIAEDRSLNSRTALQLMSRAVAVVFAEGQLFSDGNHRIAETLREYIAKGPDGINIHYILDVRKKFHPSKKIEELILHQNTMRLLSDTGTDEFEVLGGTYLDPRVVSEIATVMSDIEDRIDVSNQAFADKHNLTHVPSLEGLALAELLGDMDENLSSPLQNILSTKNYGAAALRIVYGGSKPNYPITEDKAAQLLSIDRKLHIMRQMSLLGSVMGRGIVDIKDDNSGKRVIEVLPWNAK